MDVDPTGYQIYLAAEDSIIWLTVNNQLQFKVSGCAKSRLQLLDVRASELKLNNGNLYVQMKDSNDLLIYDSTLKEINRISGNVDDGGKLV